MKVVILAGGLGTRISEYTKTIPKPMVKINGKPIILRIMNYFAKAGHNDFYIALGYKGEIIRKYFKHFKSDWNINLIDTGKKTMTGGRLKRLKKYLKNETFLMTYGDGLSNVNIDKLIRFGYLKLNNGLVKYFKEKSRSDEGWINGGFFVINSKFLKYIKNDKTYLEREPLENLTSKNQLSAFKHEGFWQCMDTLRDKKNLEKSILNKKLQKIFD